ncbi:MAG: CDP-alcohol phosphatidyltransferase family protein, partial [Candidatus Binatia bacterium]
AVVGFRALQAVFEPDYRRVFSLLALALFIDATDGVLARAARVKQVIPWIDGTLLDNIVDYLTYVVVPVAVFSRPGVLPEEFKGLCLLVLLASAYGFSRTDAKGLVEHYFLGFPSYWNVVAFYFIVLDTGPYTNVAVLTAALVLVVIPMRWLYPSRTEFLRRGTLSLGAVWAVMAVFMLIRLPEPSPTLAIVSLFYPVYYAVASLVFHVRS